MQLAGLSRTLLLSFLCLGAELTMGAPAPQASVQEAAGPKFRIAHEKYRLSNGLEVILHVDKSDPIVAVYVVYHVGSAREEPGRTGMAHLFEHLRFSGSQHVPPGEWFKKLQAVGASTINGSTNRDRTNYYQVVPRNALELALWMESDRMGFLLSRLTPEAFHTQQNVVQNEKRQYDNQPYSQKDYIVGKLLYPERHPYNWQVIGSLEDLGNSRIQDAVEFHNRYYGPGNATLVVAGDIDLPVAKRLISRYFLEIPSRVKVEPLEKMPVVLKKSGRAVHEDKLATAPLLTMVFPTVEQFHPDAYPLQFLARILAGSKKSPLYRILVEEKKLVPAGSGGGGGRRGGGGSGPALTASQRSSEVAGEFQIGARAFPEVKLSDVEAAIRLAFERFESEGFSEGDVERQKAGIEARYYRSTSGVLDKAMRLADYNLFMGSPEAMAEDLKANLAVTKEDVWRVYQMYLKDKPCVLVSIVPEGRPELAATDSTPFPIPEESIDEQGTKLQRAEGYKPPVLKPLFDRSREPKLGPDPVVKVPAIWTDKTANGIPVHGIVQNEVPLVQFTLVLRGGALLDPAGKEGVALLTARLLNEGTRSRTPVALKEAIDDLGATISISADGEATQLVVNCLAGKMNEALSLAREMLLDPRWDEKEFELLKGQAVEQARREDAVPTSIAARVFAKLVHGAESPLARSATGTSASLEAISLADLKAYYARAYSPAAARLLFVGAVTQEQALAGARRFADWKGGAVALPELKPSGGAKPGVYFVDVPKARQSVVTAGHAGPRQTDPDFYKAVVMQHRLGGDFSGVLNMILREKKSFTYGARSAFTGGEFGGLFKATTQVQANATRETLQIIRAEVAKYRGGLSAPVLLEMKGALMKSNAGKYETLEQLTGMLLPVALYGLKPEYAAERQELLRRMTPAEQRALAQKYLQPAQMVYLVVGDYASQFKAVAAAGLGAPTLLDREGRPLSTLPTPVPQPSQLPRQAAK